MKGLNRNNEADIGDKDAQRALLDIKQGKVGAVMAPPGRNCVSFSKVQKHRYRLDGGPNGLCLVKRECQFDFLRQNVPNDDVSRPRSLLGRFLKVNEFEEGDQSSFRATHRCCKRDNKAFTRRKVDAGDSWMTETANPAMNLVEKNEIIPDTHAPVEFLTAPQHNAMLGVECGHVRALGGPRNILGLGPILKKHQNGCT